MGGMYYLKKDSWYGNPKHVVHMLIVSGDDHALCGLFRQVWKSAQRVIGRCRCGGMKQGVDNQQADLLPQCVFLVGDDMPMLLALMAFHNIDDPS